MRGSPGAQNTRGGPGGIDDVFSNALSALGTGLLKSTAGVLSIAVAGTDYVSPSGVAGGQSITGGTAAGDDLTLTSTSDGTKGDVLIGTKFRFDEVNGRLRVGDTTAPTLALEVVGSVYATGANPRIIADSSSGLPGLSLRDGGSEKASLSLSGSLSLLWNCATAGQGHFFQIGGTSMLEVGASAVVIGTGDTPVTSGIFRVFNAGDAQCLVRNTVNDVEFFFGTNGLQGWLATFTNHPLIFAVNGSEGFRLATNGRIQFAAAGITANGSGAVTAPGAIGPAAISVQEWATVQNASGTTRYIPLYG